MMIALYFYGGHRDNANQLELRTTYQCLICNLLLFEKMSFVLPVSKLYILSYVSDTDMYESGKSTTA